MRCVIMAGISGKNRGVKRYDCQMFNFFNANLSTKFIHLVEKNIFVI